MARGGSDKSSAIATQDAGLRLHRARVTESERKRKREKSTYEVIDVCYVYTDACVQSLRSIDVRANFRARRGTRERD